MPDAFQINHETIYTALCVICMSELRRQTLERLPHDHKSRQPRGAGLKGTNLSVHSQANLDTVAFHHSTKPHKSLGWKSPIELSLPSGSFDFRAYWTTIINPVALGL